MHIIYWIVNMNFPSEAGRSGRREADLPWEPFRKFFKLNKIIVKWKFTSYMQDLCEKRAERF